MKINFFIFCAKFFLLFLLFNNAFADSSNPRQFIQEIVDQAKEILVDSNSDKYKSDKLTEIALATVDINGVGFYTLGSYRKDLTEEQKKEYTILFKKYFIKTFVSRLTDYSEPKIDVVSAEKKNEKYTIVSSILLAKLSPSMIKSLIKGLLGSFV